MPPLYRAEPFGTGGPYSGSQGLPGNDFHHRQETSNFGPLDSGSASTNIQESVQVQGQGIQVEDYQDQRVKVQENQNQGGQEQNQNLGVQEPSQNQVQEQNREQIQQQNQNLRVQEQSQNQGIQQKIHNQRIQQQSLNQWIEQQNQNQGLQQQNQNQGVQQQNQNQGPPIRETQGQGIQQQQNQGYQSEKEQFQPQSELVPSIGGQVSSEQIHFEKSPLIDLTVSSTTATPLTFTHSVTTPSSFGNVPEASTRSSSLIDYLVSGFDDRIPASGSTGTGPLGSTGTGPLGATGTAPLGSESIGSTGSEEGALESSESDLVNQGRDQESYGTLGYNDKKSFMEEFMESYYNFKKEEAMNASRAQATNSASSGTSGEDLLYLTPSSRAVKRNKQVSDNFKMNDSS